MKAKLPQFKLAAVEDLLVTRMSHILILCERQLHIPLSCQRLPRQQVNKIDINTLRCQINVSPVYLFSILSPPTGPYLEPPNRNSHSLGRVHCSEFSRDLEITYDKHIINFALYEIYTL